VGFKQLLNPVDTNRVLVNSDNNNSTGTYKMYRLKHALYVAANMCLMVALFACALEGNITVKKDVSGRTFHSTPEEKAYTPIFNAVRFLDGKLTLSVTDRGKGNIKKETIYQDGKKVLSIQYVLLAWFNDASITSAKNRSGIDRLLSRTGHTDLNVKPIELQHRGIFGYYAENDKCVVAEFTKRIKGRTQFGDDEGNPDIFASLSTCGIKVSAKEFIMQLGFAESSDGRFLSNE